MPSETELGPSPTRRGEDAAGGPATPRVPELVEVREEDGSGRRPAQLLGRDGFWIVRTACRLPPVASRPRDRSAAPAAAGVAGAEVERWRVSAGQGVAGRQDVFELARDQAGRWWRWQVAG